MTKPVSFARLEATFETSGVFLAHVRKQGNASSFFVAGADGSPLPDGRAGTIYSVTLRFADRETEFHVHGRVVERHAGDPARGLRLAFLPEEKDRQELVLAYVEGESVPYLRRKAIRTPCDLAADVVLADGSVLRARLSNISERGTQLSVSSLKPDQRIELSISFSAQKKLRVLGRVTGIVGGPDSGVGIEFLFESTKQRAELATEVTQLRSRS